MDPFKTLGIESKFAVDLADLEQRHRDLSRALHPDRHVGKPANERRMILSKAIEANEAWRILKDPVRRAEAVAAGLGLVVGEVGAPSDPALLMDIMEQREELADVRLTRDAERLKTLLMTMRTRESALLVRLGEVLDNESLDDKSAALTHLSELKFVRRFLDEARLVEDELL